MRKVKQVHSKPDDCPLWYDGCRCAEQGWRDRLAFGCFLSLEYKYDSLRHYCKSLEQEYEGLRAERDRLVDENAQLRKDNLGLAAASAKKDIKISRLRTQLSLANEALAATEGK